MSLRFVSYIILTLLLIYAHWVLFAIGLLLAISFMPSYVEGLMFALAADLLYGTPFLRLEISAKLISFTAITFFILIFFETVLKERLRWYRTYG